MQTFFWAMRAGLDEVRHRDSDKQTHDGYYDHDFHERKALRLGA